MALTNSYSKRLLKMCKELCDSDFRFDSLWEIIESGLNRFSEKEYIEFFSKQNNNEFSFCLNILYNTIGDCLESGEFHLYRGWLSPEGVDLYKFYLKIESLILSENLATKDFLDRNREIILQHIKEVG